MVDIAEKTVTKLRSNHKLTSLLSAPGLVSNSAYKPLKNELSETNFYYYYYYYNLHKHTLR